MFFFILLLSYVFADGELNFNYFAVEVKSCFVNIKSFPSSAVCIRQRHKPMLFNSCQSYMFFCKPFRLANLIDKTDCCFVLIHPIKFFTSGTVATCLSKQDLASAALSLLPFHHCYVLKWSRICLACFIPQVKTDSVLIYSHLKIIFYSTLIKRYLNIFFFVEVVTIPWPSQPNTVWSSYQTA